MDALLKKTGAHYVFGTSTGGIIALQSALCLHDIHKAILFELPIYVNKVEMDNFNDIVQRFDRELAEGKLTSAMLTAGEVSTKVMVIQNHIGLSYPMCCGGQYSELYWK